MGGALSRRVAPAKRSLVELIALLEAGIDFAEDDIDVRPRPLSLAHRRNRRALTTLEPPSVAAASSTMASPLHRWPPNVGKSSLFNRLVERNAPS